MAALGHADHLASLSTSPWSRRSNTLISPETGLSWLLEPEDQLVCILPDLSSLRLERVKDGNKGTVATVTVGDNH